MAYATEERINEFLNSKTMLAVAALAFVVMCFVVSAAGGLREALPDGHGVFFSVSDRNLSPQLSIVLNSVCVAGIVVLAQLLNKQYSFIRAVTYLFGSMFFMLELAFPFVVTHLNMGTILCLITVLGQFILFSTYQQKRVSQQRVFLTFTILSTGCIFHYAFLVLEVAFFLGFLQMRGMNFRGVLAAILGMLCPVWIGVGFGLIDPTAAMAPTISWSLSEFTDTQLPVLIIALLGCACLIVLLMALNVATTINYRLQLRVYNSFYLTLSLLALLMMLLDAHNVLIYVPLLNYCLAMQVAQAFTIQSGFLRRYIPVLLIMMACVAVAVLLLL